MAPERMTIFLYKPVTGDELHFYDSLSTDWTGFDGENAQPVVAPWTVREGAGGTTMALALAVQECIETEDGKPNSGRSK